VKLCLVLWLGFIFKIENPFGLRRIALILIYTYRRTAFILQLFLWLTKIIYHLNIIDLLIFRGFKSEYWHILIIEFVVR